MSVADLPTPAPPVVRRPVAAVSPRFLRSELRLMLGRRRNQAGLVVLAAVPVLISVSVKSSLSRPGEDAPDFFRSITENGLFVALAALTIEMGLFLPLAVAVVAGATCSPYRSPGSGCSWSSSPRSRSARSWRRSPWRSWGW